MLPGESHGFGRMGGLGEIAKQAQVFCERENGWALLRERGTARKFEEGGFFFFSEFCHKLVRCPQVDD